MRRVQAMVRGAMRRTRAGGRKRARMARLAAPGAGTLRAIAAAAAALGALLLAAPLPASGPEPRERPLLLDPAPAASAVLRAPPDGGLLERAQAGLVERALAHLQPSAPGTR